MHNYLSLVKFSHTIFALPFAIIGFLLGAKSINFDIPLKLPFLVLGCMVFARTAAMSFNRYIDRDIDALNERTKNREVPAGVVKPKQALGLTIISSILFIVCTYFINPLCFYLSPVALAVVLGYSYAKRFTSLCHFILGIGLALAPIGAYLAVTESFHIIPLLFSVAVLFWVSGFDIIYALQDDEFDKEQNLKSIPTFLGRKNALNLSVLLHFVCSMSLLAAGVAMEASWIYFVGWILFSIILFYQHKIINPKDLSRVNLAFFTTNGVASVVFALLFIAEVFL
ncbi:MAG: putative 4-hydroxybenzoate polyprenyltransferase [Bacteroidia bacterium]|nr:putative 4-hydroxybenzoate polyprenyltransferase [Bacteroidia bacterium]NNC85145.1 UbiA family prenyltransferase [Bacteroidia bacterium]